jgi:hypothetical protein
LDIHSLCQAAASCSLFKKIAMEPACYRNVDLTYCNVDNSVVAKIIQNAGQYLRYALGWVYKIFLKLSIAHLLLIYAFSIFEHMLMPQVKSLVIVLKSSSIHDLVIFLDSLGYILYFHVNNIWVRHFGLTKMYLIRSKGAVNTTMKICYSHCQYREVNIMKIFKLSTFKE